MIDDDFVERARAAAGVPTTAERKAQVERNAAEQKAQRDKVAQEQAEWVRGEPERRKYLDQYNTIVRPIIKECLAKCSVVAGERMPPHDIMEDRQPSATSLPPEMGSGGHRENAALCRQLFYLRTAPLLKQAQGRTASPGQGTNVAALQIFLNCTGGLVIDVCDPKKNLPPSTEGTSIDQIERTHIEEGFLKLLEKLKMPRSQRVR